MKIDGMKVVDSKKRIAIQITKKDIQAASRSGRKDPGSCAAAQAAMRQLKGQKVSQVRFQLGRTYLLHGKKWLRYQTPGSLRSEIISFDRGGDFEPGYYYLIPPTPSMQLGAGVGSYTNKTRPKKYHKTRAKHIMANVRKIEGINRRG